MFSRIFYHRRTNNNNYFQLCERVMYFQLTNNNKSMGTVTVSSNYINTNNLHSIIWLKVC